MKRFTSYLIVLAIVLTALSAFVTIPAAAATNVIFISDDGIGDGSSPEYALKATTGNYDASSSNPEKQRDSVLYQAVLQMMEKGGGTIVLCGEVWIDGNVGQGTGTQKDFRFAFNEYKPDVTITYTSVYNGVDYRETKGARLIFDDQISYTCPSASVFENIDIQNYVSGNMILGGFNKLTMGEGVRCFDEGTGKYICIAGGERSRGTRYMGSLGKDRFDTNVTIKSGTYSTVCGGQAGAGAEHSTMVGDSYVTIDGGMILGANEWSGLIGTNRDGATPMDGNVNITINGGVFCGPIWGCGPGGFVNADAKVNIKVNGGDFLNVKDVSAYAASVINNKPASAELDFSALSGNSAIALNDNIKTDTFTDVKIGSLIPEVTTTEEVVTTTEPVTDPIVTTTDPIQSTTEDPGTDEPVPGTTTKDPATDPASPTTDAPSEDPTDNTMTIVIIVLAVILAVGIGAAVFIALRRKNK